MYRAAPNGLARGELAITAGPIFGEERGLGEAEALPERGRSSSLRRFSCGVGGVELPAKQYRFLII